MTPDYRWSAFVAVNGPLIRQWLAARQLPPWRAEDLTQEILLKVLRFLAGTCRADEALRPWLGHTIHDAVTDFGHRHVVPNGAGRDTFQHTIERLLMPAAVEELVSSLHPLADSSVTRPVGPPHQRTRDSRYRGRDVKVRETHDLDAGPRELPAGSTAGLAGPYRVRYWIRDMNETMRDEDRSP